MGFMSVVAKVVEGIGAVIVSVRHKGAVVPQAMGTAPSIPMAKPQGSLPTLKMPTARGWHGGRKPVVAAGLKVNAFATDLKHPRWMTQLPNGDILTAEARFIPGGAPKTPFDLAMQATMRRAAALGDSPNRITLLRDADADGVAETRETFLAGQNQPFGMVLIGQDFYVGNTDGLVRFTYTDGATKLTGPATRIASFPPGGHWTRSILPNADKTKLYVGVGSMSNIAENGLAEEKDRAAIHEIDLATGQQRLFATGLRNPVGLAWEPVTGTLWTVVNERDGLGDETPPDYLTSVQDGGFYGWPFCYWGRTVDDRVPQDAALVSRAIQPDYALGGHTASLGLCWMPAGTLPGFGDGMVIGQHGSWNRSKLSGYRVIHVPFANGKPSGAPKDILSGFLSPDERESYGRPVGVMIDAKGALLVADDVGDVIWRVTAG